MCVGWISLEKTLDSVTELFPYHCCKCQLRMATASWGGYYTRKRHHLFSLSLGGMLVIPLFYYPQVVYVVLFCLTPSFKLLFINFMQSLLLYMPLGSTQLACLVC